MENNPQNLWLINKLMQQESTAITPDTFMGATAQNAGKFMSAGNLNSQDLDKLSITLDKLTNTITNLLDHATKGNFTGLLGDSGKALVGTLLQSPFAQNNALVQNLLGNPGSSVSAMHGVATLTQNAGFKISGVPTYGPSEANAVIAKGLYQGMQNQFLNDEGLPTQGVSQTELGSAYSIMASRGAFRGESIGKIDYDLKGNASIEIDENKQRAITRTVGKMAQTLKSLQEVFTDKSFSEIADISERLTGIQMITPQNMQRVKDRVRGFANMTSTLGVDQTAAIQTWSQNTSLIRAVGVGDNLAGSMGEDITRAQMIAARQRDNPFGAETASADEIATTQAAFAQNFGSGFSALSGAQRDMAGTMMLLDNNSDLLKQSNPEAYTKAKELMTQMSRTTDPEEASRLSQQVMKIMHDSDIATDHLSGRDALASFGMSANEALNSLSSDFTGLADNMLDNNRTMSQRADLTRAIAEKSSVRSMAEKSGVNLDDMSAAVTGMLASISTDGQESIKAVLSNTNLSPDEARKRLTDIYTKDAGTSSMSAEDRERSVNALALGRETQGLDFLSRIGDLTAQLNTDPTARAVIAANSGNQRKASLLAAQESVISIESVDTSDMSLQAAFLEANGDAKAKASANRAYLEGSAKKVGTISLSKSLQAAQSFAENDFDKSALNQDQLSSLNSLESIYNEAKKTSGDPENFGSFNDWITQNALSEQAPEKIMQQIRNSGLTATTAGTTFAERITGRKVSEGGKAMREMLDKAEENGGFDLISTQLQDDKGFFNKIFGSDKDRFTADTLLSLGADSAIVESYNNAASQDERTDIVNNYLNNNLSDPTFVRSMSEYILTNPELADVSGDLEQMVAGVAGINDKSFTDTLEGARKERFEGTYSNPDLVRDLLGRDFGAIGASIKSLDSEDRSTFLSNFNNKLSEEQIAKLSGMGEDDWNKYVDTTVRKQSGFDKQGLYSKDAGVGAAEKVVNALAATSPDDEISIRKSLSTNNDEVNDILVRTQLAAESGTLALSDRSEEENKVIQERALKKAAQLRDIQQRLDRGAYDEEELAGLTKKRDSLMGGLEAQQAAMLNLNTDGVTSKKYEWGFAGKLLGATGDKVLDVDKLDNKLENLTFIESPDQITEASQAARLEGIQNIIAGVNNEFGEEGRGTALNSLSKAYADVEKQLESADNNATTEALAELKEVIASQIEMLSVRDKEVTQSPEAAGSENFIGRLQLMGSDSVELIVNKKG